MRSIVYLYIQNHALIVFCEESVLQPEEDNRDLGDERVLPDEEFARQPEQFDSVELRAGDKHEIEVDSEWDG